MCALALSGIINFSRSVSSLSAKRLSCIFPLQQCKFSNISLSNLRPAAGSHKQRKRVGRGSASGSRTCGKGSKGQKSRSGPGIRSTFEGGQTPFHIRFPQSNRPGPPLIHHLQTVGLDRIQHLLNTKRLNAEQPITLASLQQAGVKSLNDGVKVLANNWHKFHSKINIQATAFSKDAIKRIEALGGTAVAVFHTAQAVKELTRPHLNERHSPLPTPKLKAPTDRQRHLYYSLEENRGYLHPNVRSFLLALDPSFDHRYETSEPSTAPMQLHKPLDSIVDDLRLHNQFPK